jgi:hypothetical protein
MSHLERLTENICRAAILRGWARGRDVPFGTVVDAGYLHAVEECVLDSLRQDGYLPKKEVVNAA